MIAVSARSFCCNSILCEDLKRVFPRTEIRFAESKDVDSAEAFIGFVSFAESLIIGKEVLSREVLSRLPRLKFVSKYGVGIDNIDFDACRDAGVEVTYQPGVNASSVAEFTIGLIISLMRRIELGSHYLRAGQWVKNGGLDLNGKTVAVIGCGNVGTKVCYLLKAFNCKVLICDIVDKSGFAAELGASQVDLNQCLQCADIVSLHVPLTPDTQHMINGNSLSLMKSTGFLINTCRGKVVNEDDLASVLSEGKIQGCAMDVFNNEPFVPAALLKSERFLGTPHIAGNSVEAVLAMGRASITGLQRIVGS